MSQATRLHKRGRQHIVDCAATVKAIWDAMCQADGIEPNASVAVFSEATTAKYGPFYSRALQMYREAVAEYQAGGYGGLSIVNGRAQ